LTFSSHDSVSGNALGCSFDYNTVIFSLRGGNRTIVGNGMRSLGREMQRVTFS